MLYKKLDQYNQSDFYPFHTPGHKRNEQLINNKEMIKIPFGIDVTEIDGFDDMHNPQEIIGECMDFATKSYGTMQTYFLVNGSSCGVLASISAVADSNDKVIVARNCHKSVYNAISLRQLNAVYIYPEEIEEYGVAGQISVKSVQGALEEHPDAKAVIITSPTYDGIVSDIQKISAEAHNRNIPLIVDEAHGAHFKYSDIFPMSAIELGADLAIHSLHKTLPSLTQTALLHLNSKLVDIKKIEQFLRIYQTTSPSYVLMASIDRCIRFMEENAQSLYQQYDIMIQQFYDKCTKLKNIKVIPYTFINKDISKIVISIKSYNLNIDSQITGSKLSDILREQYHLEMEMTGKDYVIGITTAMDTDAGLNRLWTALLEIDTMIDRNDKDLYCKEENDSQKRIAYVKSIAGTIADDYVYVYPPGIPILIPGEEWTQGKVEQVISSLKSELHVYGVENYE